VQIYKATARDGMALLNYHKAKGIIILIIFRISSKYAK
jgi:hypothetical protein